MAERVFRNTLSTQNHDSATFYRGFSKIVEMSYGGEREDLVGEEMYGVDDLGTDGLHHEVHFHTRLQGQAALVPDNVRQHFPMASYETGWILVQGYDRIGIADEYYPEDLEDNLPGFEWLATKAQDLPMLVRDTEEDLMWRLYNEGETRVVGHARTPLFVDGDTDKLQLLGKPDYFSGTAASNIIEGGGVSHAMLHLAKQYGDNFINEEGRPERLRVVMIAGRAQNIDLVEKYVTSPTNVESYKPNEPNPSASLQGVKLLRTQRMSQPNDLIVFYSGWEDDIKMREKYRGRADTWEDGHAQFRKIVSQVRSRLGFYAYNNRRVVLMRGAS